MLLLQSCLIPALAALIGPSAPQDPPFDLLIRNGRIVDGTGNPWFAADLGIRGDRIVALGKLDEQANDARRTIDATGLVIAPGFIDIHSHSDRTLFVDGAAPSKVFQGVTTDILGEQDSGGPNLGPLTADPINVNGQPRTIRTMADYLNALDDANIAINAATYVGLGNIWGSVMGTSFTRPTPEQFEQMKAILAQALEDGALGLSNALASPDAAAVTTDDLVELAHVVARYGGVYSSHIRNEGTDVLQAVDEAITIGERAGVPVDIIHVKIADQRLWGHMAEIIEKVEEARRRGVNVQTNVYPYTRGNNDLVSIVPPWAHESGIEALLARLRDSDQRTRIVNDVLNGLPGWYNHYLAVGGDWSRMLISARLTEPNAQFQGQTMDHVLTERTEGQQLDDAGQIAAMLDFLAEEGGSVATIYAHHTEEDMNLALSQPWCSVGSDGSALGVDGPLRALQGHPHPRNFGTFPRVLGVYVREKGLLRLEDAIRKMTSLNAAKVGILNRGLLRPRLFADVTIFDPASIIDHSTYLEPFHYSEGIEYVIVNGEVILDGGSPTNARPGRALRSNQQSRHD